jgi:hypothetical protein
LYSSANLILNLIFSGRILYLKYPSLHLAKKETSFSQLSTPTVLLHEGEALMTDIMNLPIPHIFEKELTYLKCKTNSYWKAASVLHF